MLQSLNKNIEQAIQCPWTARYAKGIALVLLYGALVHLSNIAGLSGSPWLSTPLLWRSLDIILLVFNLVTALGLWQKRTGAVWLLYGGIILLQWVPYTLWRSQFILNPEDAQTLNGLMGTEALLLMLFGLLLFLKK